MNLDKVPISITHTPPPPSPSPPQKVAPWETLITPDQGSETSTSTLMSAFIAGCMPTEPFVSGDPVDRTSSLSPPPFEERASTSTIIEPDPLQSNALVKFEPTNPSVRKRKTKWVITCSYISHRSSIVTQSCEPYDRSRSVAKVEQGQTKPSSSSKPRKRSRASEGTIVVKRRREKEPTGFEPRWPPILRHDSQGQPMVPCVCLPANVCKLI